MKVGGILRWLLLAGITGAMPGLRYRQVQTSSGCTCPANGLATKTVVQYDVITSSTTVTAQGSTSFSTGSATTRFIAEFSSTMTVVTNTLTVTRPGVTETTFAQSAITSTITAASTRTTCIVSAIPRVKRQATSLSTVGSADSIPSTLTYTSNINSRAATCVCRLISPTNTLAGASSCSCPATTTTTVTVSSIATSATIVTVTVATPTMVMVTPTEYSTIVIPSVTTSSSLATFELVQSSLTVTSVSFETIYTLYTPIVISCPASISSTSTTASRSTTSTSSSVIATGTFVCNSTAYLIGSTETNGAVDLYNIDLRTGKSIVIARTIGAGTYVNINAMGYNPLDNYLYAIGVLANGNSEIIRFTTTGSVRQILTFRANGELTSGDVDTNGQFWAFSGSLTWYHFDLAPGSSTYGKIINNGTSTLSGYNVYDWSYLVGNGDYMYSIAETTDSSPNFAVLRWSQTTHVWSVVDTYPNAAAPNYLVANWGSSNGTLWGLQANTGQVTRVSLGGSPVAIGTGPVGLVRGDGARCGLAS